MKKQLFLLTLLAGMTSIMQAHNYRYNEDAESTDMYENSVLGALGESPEALSKKADSLTHKINQKNQAIRNSQEELKKQRQELAITKQRESIAAKKRSLQDRDHQLKLQHKAIKNGTAEDAN